MASKIKILNKNLLLQLVSTGTLESVKVGYAQTTKRSIIVLADMVNEPNEVQQVVHILMHTS